MTREEYVTELRHYEKTIKNLKAKIIDLELDYLKEHGYNSGETVETPSGEKMTVLYSTVDENGLIKVETVTHRSGDTSDWYDTEVRTYKGLNFNFKRI